MHKRVITLGTNCVQRVGGVRDKQVGILPQDSRVWGISHSPAHNVSSYTLRFPTYPLQLFTTLYTRFSSHVTDMIRYLSTVSTPPIITITTYI